MAGSGLELQLGDIVHVVAPRNEGIGDAPLLVKQFGKEWVRLVGASGEKIEIPLSASGAIEDETVEAIELLSRSDEPGYAKQNGLVPGRWIDLHLGGDLPMTLTGQITDLDQDQIEIKVVDGGEPLYIDFGYRGVPEDLPIERIHLRDAPPKGALPAAAEAEIRSEERVDRGEEETKGVEEDEDAEFAETGMTEQGEIVREEMLDPEEIVMGDDLGAVQQIVDVPAEERRFGLENQTTDMLDDLLSAIPSSQRSAERINAVHQVIERFKQLRTEFSQFEGTGHVKGAFNRGPAYKPLVDSLVEFAETVPWVLPISRNRKKLYDIDAEEADEYEDVARTEQAQTRTEETRMVAAYENNSSADGTNRYDTLLRELAPLLLPWEPPNSESTDTLISTRVADRIATVVDNNDDFYSSVFANKGVGRQRFFVQPHAPGLDVLSIVTHRSGEKTFARRAVTAGDPVSASGLLTLPAFAVSASRAVLPGTMLGVRIDQAQLMAKATSVLTESTTVRTVYAGDESTGRRRNTLNEVTEFIPAPTGSTQSWRAFLQSAVPSTEAAIREWVPANPTPPLSVSAAVSWLEPFKVYSRDVHLESLILLKEMVTAAQKSFSSAYTSGVRRFSIQRRTPPGRSPALLTALSKDAGRSIVAQVQSGYGLTDTLLAGMLNGELLERIRMIDGGRLLMAALARVSVKLMVGDPEAEARKLTERAEVNAKATSESSKAKCAKAVPVLAKKYMAEDELAEDNGKEAWFDKNLDPTFYDVLPGYASVLEGKESSEAKMKALEAELGERVGMTGAAARREAAALLVGKRAVEDGDHAVVEPEGSEGDAIFFVRKAGSWVRAPTLSRSTFEQSPKVTCALQPGCVDTRGVCEPTKVAAASLVQQDMKAIEEEFDAAMEKDVARRRKAAEVAYARALGRVARLIQLETTNHLRVQRERSAIGSAATLESVERSPHSKLRDMILAQGDFAKRQTNIAGFVTRFTRPAYAESDENRWWLYCVDSGLKLLPTFLSTLADAFLEGRDYLEVARRICADQGTISDDGDAWVDKHSGYSIVPIDYDDDEGYNEAGFKVQTRAVLEEDLGMGDKVATGAMRYSDPLSKSIARTAAGLASFLGVPIEASLAFIVRGVSTIIAKAMPSRERYEKNMAMRRERGKKGGLSYDQARSQMMVLLTSSFTLLAIQTQIPPVIPTIRHPGCVATLDGYPAGAESDLGAVKYVACVLRSISRSIPPWDSLKGVSTATLAKKLQAFLSGQVIVQPESKQRMADRREFDRLNPSLSVAVDPALLSWSGFLPPLNPVKVQNVEGLTPALQRTIETEVRKGSATQTDKLRMLRGREILLGLKVVELIERTVSTKSLSLANATGEPYLENSCCDDGERNPLEYFVRAQPAILEKNREAALARDFLDYMGAMATAPYLFDAEDTRRRFPAPPPGFSEETIYRAFIVLCKFNSEVAASARLRGVCMEKPDSFDVSLSIDEKIALLKGEGHNYSVDSLNALMRVVNEDNLVSLDLGRIALGPVQDVRATLESDRDEYGQKLVNLLAGALEQKKEGEVGRELRNFLAEEGARARKELDTFLGQFGRGRAARRARECLPRLGAETDTVPIWVYKERARLLGKVFPNIVLNSVDYAETPVPAHWKLSEAHNLDVERLIARYYHRISQFAGNPRLRPVLSRYSASSAAFIRLMDQLHVEGDDSPLSARTVQLLSGYILDQLFVLIVHLATRSPQVLAESSASLDAEEEEDGTLDPAIEMGAQESLASKAAAYLVAVIETLCEQERMCDMSYEEVMYRVRRAKEHEKDTYTRRLRELTDEERDANMQLKKNKLGEWGKGLQKGMRSYQGETYDEEIADMEAQALLEMRMGNAHMVTQMNRDIYAMDAIAEQAEADRIEAEEMSIAHLGDDDDHGDLDGDEGY